LVDINDLRLDPASAAALLNRGSKRARQQTPQVLGKFLRGPIPLAWLEAAANCGLNALRVGLAAWYVSGKNNWATTVSITNADVKRLGLSDRSAKRLALRRLKKAGLIDTNQIGHNSVEVTIVRIHGD
jgi:hypothetical protein